MRLAANTLAEGVQNNVAETVGNIPLEDHVALNERNLRRTVQSARKRARMADEDEGNYSSLDNLVLPRCNVGQPWSVNPSDTGVGPDRILALGVLRHVQMLENSSVILGDGTFQVTPSLWKQQYTLHANVQGFCFPVIFLLLPGKTKTIYRQVLRILQDIVPDVAHKVWIFDYEASMLNAHKESMPEATSAGCFFHLSKAVQRKWTLWVPHTLHGVHGIPSPRGGVVHTGPFAIGLCCSSLRFSENGILTRRRVHSRIF